MNILSFETLDSTNACALKLAEAGADPETVVWAQTQTSGRGQYGRIFVSPPGGLYFSLLLQPDLEPERLPLVTLAAGVGCCRFLERHCGLSTRLKWPNDLYCRKRKLGGILTETMPITANRPVTVVVGIGLNFNSTTAGFPEDMLRRITSVHALTGETYELRVILPLLAREIMERIQALHSNQDKLLALWNERDYLKGHPILWETGRKHITGTGRGLADDGCYILEDQGGKRHTILAGRVQPLTCPTADS